MKKTISLTVDVDTWIQAKTKVPNVSAYINECLIGLLGRTAEDNTLEELEIERAKINKELTEWSIKQSINAQAIKDFEAKKAEKQAKERELEQFRRWDCGACHHLNFMDNVRCDKCNLPMRDSAKSKIIMLNGGVET